MVKLALFRKNAKMVQVTSNPNEDEKPILPQQPAVYNQSDDDKHNGHDVLGNKEAMEQFLSNFKNLPHSADAIHLLLQMFSAATVSNNKVAATQIAYIISSKIDKHNSLTVLREIATTRNEGGSFEPSAPPIVENDHLETWVAELKDNLRHNCFLEILKNADFVLQKDEILELNSADLERVLSNDNLQTSSELEVYKVVMKWAKLECKRRGLNYGSTNLKGILNELAHCPRYGLMSEKEFLCRTIEDFKGPDRSGILEEHETEKILAYIKKRRKTHNPEELPYKASKPRRAMADPKKMLEGDKKTDKLVLGLLTCWTAVFD